MMPPESPVAGYGDFVKFLNDLNADWIRASRRLSPQFFNALTEEDARRRIETEGDADLLQKLFSVRGVMV